MDVYHKDVHSVYGLLLYFLNSEKKMNSIYYDYLIVIVQYTYIPIP